MSVCLSVCVYSHQALGRALIGIIGVMNVFRVRILTVRAWCRRGRQRSGIFIRICYNAIVWGY